MPFLHTPNGLRPHLVTLANAVRVSDGAGGYRESWVPLDPAAWYVGIFTAAPSDEHIAGHGVQSSIRHTVRGPYRPDVTTATVITKAGTGGRPDRRFYVRGLDNPDEGDVELVCDCEEAPMTKPAAR